MEDRRLRRACAVRRVSLLLAVAVLAAGLAPRAFGLEAGGIELTSPVKQNLKRLQDRWQDWLTAYLEEDPEKAAEALDKLMETVQSLGMERLPDLSVTAAALAVRSAEEGKDESREELGMTWLVLGLGLGFCDTHLVHFSICACHPCTGAMLIFSVSFQFAGRIPFGLGFIGFRVGFRGSGLRVSALRN